MATIRVSNQAQLEDALDDVRGGDTILLSAGRYAELLMKTRWNKDYNFDEKVTIASEDPSNPAQINQMFFRDVSNIDVRNIRFDHDGTRAAGTESFRRDAPFFVEQARNLTIDDVSFEGNVQNGFGQDLGLRIKNSQNVIIRDSEFSDFENGMSVSNTEDVTISGNLVRGMSNDGMTFGGITNMVLAGNEFRDFRSPDPKSLHMDNIQFRVGSDEPPSKNIAIRNNTFDSAEMRQTIYMGNALVTDGIKTGSTYTNIIIEGNYINSAHTHGITVFHGDGVYINDNILVSNTSMGFGDHSVYKPKINVSKYSTNVEITGNTVTSVQQPQNTTWTVDNNTITGGASWQYVHWDGTDYPQYNSMNYGVALPDPDPDPTWDIVRVDWDGSDDVLRLGGDLVDGNTRIVVDSLDFADSELVMESFGDNTLVHGANGNRLPVWDGGGAARLNSVKDFHELADFGPRVSAWTVSENDAVVLRIEFYSGVGKFVFEGLGAEFRAADGFDL